MSESNEPMSTHDCRNGHHGRLCGMTPCSCVCHANERPTPAPESMCLCVGYDRRDCAAAEPCWEDHGKAEAQAAAR